MLALLLSPGCSQSAGATTLRAPLLGAAMPSTVEEHSVQILSPAAEEAEPEPGAEQAPAAPAADTEILSSSLPALALPPDEAAARCARRRAACVVAPPSVETTPPGLLLQVPGSCLNLVDTLPLASRLWALL